MIVITGTSSGLGKFLNKNIKKSLGINKKNFSRIYKKIYNKEIDLLIHCAFNKKNTNVLDFYNSNILFLNKILKLKTKKFIFFSSVYVYEKNNDEKFIKKVKYDDCIYTFLKELSEKLILKKNKNSLILRLSSFITSYSKENNLTKLINNSADLSITKNSNYNIINPHDILKLIELISKTNRYKGIYNISSNNNIQVSQIAKIINFNKKFGKHKFFQLKIDTKKTYKNFKLFNKTSKKSFIETLNKLIPN